MKNTIHILKKYSKIYMSRINQFMLNSQIKHWLNKEILPIEIKTEIGIGAKLVWSLEILLFCEVHKLKPYFKFTWPESKKTDDFFSAYFVSNVPKNIKFIKLNWIGCLNLDKDYNKLLTLEKAHQLINEYIIPRSDIQSEVQSFLNLNFENEKVLGVHYRGTDKFREAPIVSYDKVIKNINKTIEYNGAFTKIFIMTDDQKFIHFMMNTPFSNLLCFHDDTFRSIDNDAIHTNVNLNKYDINKDAIINMLILSHCSFIIKTASFLSSISLLYNPSIPFIILNRPNEEALWFPEKQLIQRTAFEAL